MVKSHMVIELPILDTQLTYRQRNGAAVRIYATYPQQRFAIHGAFRQGPGWVARQWDCRGGSAEHCNYDLIDVNAWDKRQAQMVDRRAAA